MVAATVLATPGTPANADETVSAAKTTGIFSGVEDNLVKVELQIEDDKATLGWSFLDDSDEARLGEKMEYRADGTPATETNYYYDAAGVLQRRMETKFDAKGRILTQDFYSSDRKREVGARLVTVGQKTFFVSTADKSAKRLYRLHHGVKVLAIYGYQNGNIMRSEHPSASDNSSVRYAYRAAGQFLSKTQSRPGITTSRSQYGATGRRNAQSIFNRRGELNQKVTYTYTARGRFKKMLATGDEQHEMQVEYDNAGRMREYVVRRDGKMAGRFVTLRNGQNRMVGATVYGYNEGEPEGRMEIRDISETEMETIDFDADGKKINRRVVARKTQRPIIEEEYEENGEKRVTTFNAAGIKQTETAYEADGTVKWKHEFNADGSEKQ
ncbi:MAG TPA: hypothetical protein VF719_02025 [Abditibacteriaceae bacterium]